MAEAGDKATLLLARVPAAGLSASCDLGLIAIRFNFSLRQDEALYSGRLLAVDDRSSLLEVQLGNSSDTSVVVAQYEVFITAPDDQEPQPLCKPWSCLTAHDDGIIFSHHGSRNILFAQLPAEEGECCGAFLFGQHAAEVLCLRSNSRVLASASADGCVKLWHLEDGSLLHAYTGQLHGKVTALEFAAPLTLAVGSSEGHLTLLDMSGHALLPVHRFKVDQGPITHLAARAAGRPAAEGGWPLPLMDAKPEPLPALLAISSSAGWLHVHQAPARGERAWPRLHHRTLAGSGALVFSPEGGYLALAAGLTPPGLLLLDTATWSTCHQWTLPSPVSGPAVRLTLYAAPRTQLPLLLQAKLPVVKQQAGGRGAGGGVTQAVLGKDTEEEGEVEGGMMAGLGLTFLDHFAPLTHDPDTAPLSPAQADSDRCSRMATWGPPLPPPAPSPATAPPPLPWGPKAAPQPSLGHWDITVAGWQQEQQEQPPPPGPGPPSPDLLQQPGLGLTGDGQGGGLGAAQATSGPLLLEAAEGGWGGLGRGVWPGLRPTTLPVGRSWLTGQKPPDIDLSDLAPAASSPPPHPLPSSLLPP
ncbi:WD40-repeat-containing domain protein, partial [Haematococcus lacustris]